MKLEVKHLRKEFGKTVAVDDLSFTLHAGEILGMAGPNGSGKTTTMNIIATLDEPTSGDVLIDGVSVLEYPDAARRAIGLPSFRAQAVPQCAPPCAHPRKGFGLANG